MKVMEGMCTYFLFPIFVFWNLESLTLKNVFSNFEIKTMEIGSLEIESLKTENEQFESLTIYIRKIGNCILAIQRTDLW